MTTTNREEMEAKVFDEAVANEYKENNLLFPENRKADFFNFSSAPKNGYLYSLYLLGEQMIQNKNVLIVACGPGFETIVLAKKGAKICAFDISSVSIEIARRRASVNNMLDCIHLDIMSVYKLPFPDGSYPFVYGSACLHHFDLEKAMIEIWRVLSPGGTAVFFEPLSNSLWLSKIRNLIPIKRDTLSPYEKQLTLDDICIIKRICESVEIKEFGLFSRIDRLIKNKKILDLISQMDSFLLIHFSFLKRFARHVVIKINKK